jgi:PAS domain S-box-containing protein
VSYGGGQVAWTADLRAQIRLAAAVSLLLAVGSLSIALIAAADARRAGRALSERLVPAATQAVVLSENLLAEQTSLRDYVTSGRPQALRSYREAADAVPPGMGQLAGLVTGDPSAPALLRRVQGDRAGWVAAAAGPQLAAVAAGNRDRALANQNAGVARPYVVAMRADLAALQSAITTEQASTAERMYGAQQTLVYVLLATVLVVVLRQVWVAVVFRQMLLRPLGQLRAAADRVAEGRYQTPVPAVGPTELADLGRSMETMRSRLYAALTDRQEAERRYRGLLEASPDAAVHVTGDGTIVLVNAQAERLFGYPRAELVGRPVEMLVPAAMRARIAASRTAYLADPQAWPAGTTAPLTALHRDGHEIPVEVSVAAVPGEQGPVLCGAVRDVTERQRTLDALREQQEHGRAIIAGASDPFISIDGTGVVADWNRAAELVFGWTAQDAKGCPLTDLIIPAEYRQAHRAGLRRVLGTGRSRLAGRRIEVSAMHRDGHRIPVELSIWRSPTGDRPVLYAFLHDISERLALQEQREQLKVQAEREQGERRLAQARRLESLGQLAGGVAHDFNNLLAVIVNYLAFVAADLEQAAAADPDRWSGTRADIDQVRLAADRAIRLTRQLLAFGRRDIAKPEVLDLHRLVTGIEQLLLRTLGEHIELRATLAAGLWHVLADAGQIEQVLVNLAVNARDAMPDGGLLCIDIDNLTVDNSYVATHPTAVPGRYVRLRVSDTGCGMSREVAERAFEPFYTTKPEGSGTGLGLATVYGIVTAAGGHAQVYSELGHGTTVTALLPATEQPAAAPGRRDRGECGPRTGSGAGRTVLLVEDEAALRQVACRILTRHGYHVLAARDGPEALALAETHQGMIHLLLTDVVMPHMLGKELATRIGRLRPATRVLYVSGYAHPVLASQGTLDPDVALLEKPFTEAALLTQVSQVLAPAT